MATTNVTEKKDEGTSTYFFPRVVHLRLADGSLLKFAPGPREVPNNLHPAEMEILKRNGVKPIGQTSKQVIVATEAAIAAPATDLDTAKVNAIQAKALAQSDEESPELANEIAKANAMQTGPAKEQALAAIAAKQKAAKETKAKLDTDTKNTEAARLKTEAEAKK
jgi:hypothetical protein